MVSRQRSFPDDPDRFRHFVPDDGSGYVRYATLNLAHAERCVSEAAWVASHPGSRRLPVDTRGHEELARIGFLNPEADPNEVVRQANLFQASIRARLAQYAEGGEALEGRLLENPHAYRALPRTLGKTLEDLLVAPADWTAIRRTDDMETVARLLVIDPRLITRTLLENLGLVDPVTERGLLQEDQLTLRATMIPEIKAILSRLEPIRRPDETHESLGDLRYFRLMRVASGPHEGEVVGTQTVQGQKILFRTDLRGAERRLAHIHFGYKEEVEKMTFIHRAIEALWQSFEDWDKPDSREALQALFQTMIELVESLEHVQDHHKQALKDQLAECVSEQDRHGRPNPSSKQARLVKARNLVGQRLATIERISKYLGEDHAKVLQVVSAQEDPLKGVRARIKAQRPWDEQFQRFRRSAPKTQYQPDLDFAREARDHVVSIQRQLRSGEAEQRGAARKEYVDLYVLCKLKEAYDSVWAMYRDISLTPEVQDPRVLLDRLESIHATLKDKSFAQSTETHAYEPAYIAMYHLLNSLKKRLRELLEIPFAPSEAEVQNQNRDLQVILQGIQGRSPLLDRLLEAVRINPQLNLWSALSEAVDPEAKRVAFKRMKQRIAEVDFKVLLKPSESIS